MKILNHIVVIAIGATLALGTPAFAEVYSKSSLLKIDKKDVLGGKGVLSGEYAFTRDKALKEHAIKEISWLTLQPGDSIGYHKHATNDDTLIIISGQGIFKDIDGKDIPVGPGDVTIVRKGNSHALANTGTVPLVFVDVIAEQ